VGEWSTPCPGRFTPGRDPVPTVQEAWWVQDRSGQMWKISPPPGFDPRTVQPVASRYTDWAIPAHKRLKRRNTVLVRFLYFCVLCRASRYLLVLRVRSSKAAHVFPRWGSPYQSSAAECGGVQRIALLCYTFVVTWTAVHYLLLEISLPTTLICGCCLSFSTRHFVRHWNFQVSLHRNTVHLLQSDSLSEYHYLVIQISPLASKLEPDLIPKAKRLFKKFYSHQLIHFLIQLCTSLLSYTKIT
jgi:hypothetical protein